MAIPNNLGFDKDNIKVVFVNQLEIKVLGFKGSRVQVFILQGFYQRFEHPFNILRIILESL